MKLKILLIIVIIIIIIILYNNKNIKINTSSLDYVRQNHNNVEVVIEKTGTVDIVTITYNNKLEMNLLKLQAHSLKYVDYNFINKIIIIYNDNGIYDFKDIINYYPDELKEKVKIVYVKELLSNYNSSSWHNQQLCKLLIAPLIESEYYIILDGKNHFVKNITKSDYFEDKKGKLFVNNPGTMIKYYYNSLKYFKIKCPYNYDSNKSNNILLTTTPFLICRKDVIDMIEMIEQKEKINFSNFFNNKQEIITEFYIYTAYLIYSKRISNYKLSPVNYTSVMNNPYNEWNVFKVHEKLLKEPHIKIFGLHRAAVDRMDNSYKLKLVELYKNYYSNDICIFINKYILGV